MSAGGIVVVGSINVDLILRCQRLPQPGETVHAGSREVAPGGKGANQAVAAARLGADVALVGAVGDDPFAELTLGLLREAGVDLTHVAVVPGPTGLAVVAVEDSGDNAILVEAGANGSVGAAAVASASGLVADAAVVLLQGEIPREGIEAAANACRGRLVVNLAPVVEVDADVLRAADPLVVNEHEGVLALRLLTGEEASDAETVVAGLRRAGVRSVVVTRGGLGALISHPAGVARVPSPHVDVVDTTGAGDAFVGALAGALAAGVGLVDAARTAARVGAFACTGRGAQPSYPWADDPLPD